MRLYSLVLLSFFLSGFASAELIRMPLTGLDRPANWKTLAPWKDKFSVDKVADEYDVDSILKPGSKPPVNSQVNGDCWAQGTTRVAEILATLVEQAALKDRQSVQQVIDCSGRGTARRGGFFAFQLFQSFGTVDQTDYPYTGRDQRCKQQGLAPRYKVTSWGYVGNPNRQPTFTEIKQAMTEHHVLGFTVTANAAMQRWRGKSADDVFGGRSCARGGTNHIVTGVGYSTAKNALRFDNSWGKTWGANGSTWIQVGCSSIAETAVWAEVAKI